MTQQGWICPKCNNANSPMAMTCQNIGCASIPKPTCEIESNPEKAKQYLTEPYTVGSEAGTGKAP